EADALEQLLLGVEAVRRATVAGPVEQSAAHELRRLVPALAFEQLGQVERLLAEALPADDRDTGADLVAQHGERAAAAHVAGRNVDVEAAASSSSTAATPTSGSKWFVNVSGQNSARRLPARGRRAANHDWKVCGANAGSRRSCDTPAAAFATRASPGVWVRKPATPGARDASRAHWSISPNAYAWRGLGLRE